MTQSETDAPGIKHTSASGSPIRIHRDLAWSGCEEFNHTGITIQNGMARRRKSWVAGDVQAKGAAQELVARGWSMDVAADHNFRVPTPAQGGR
jgi:hypothetical protein